MKASFFDRYENKDHFNRPIKIHRLFVASDKGICSSVYAHLVLASCNIDISTFSQNLLVQVRFTVNNFILTIAIVVVNLSFYLNLPTFSISLPLCSYYRAMIRRKLTRQ